MLHHERLEDAVVHRVSERLDHSALSGDLIRQTFDEALRDDPDIGNAFRADLVAVYDRDPATARFIDPLLYFKGFHAIQTHRLAHWLHQKGRKDFAYLPAKPVLVGVPDRHQSGGERLAVASSSITPPALSAARPP